MSKDEEKESSTCIVATHSGIFHCDEVLACYMLLQHVEEYLGASLLRTRKKEKLAKASIVVDVGGEYDAERKLFDHHQKSFTDTWDDKHKTPLSSAGLIWRHFGKAILKSIIEKLSKKEAATRKSKLIQWDDKSLSELQMRVYDKLIESIDADDNGIEVCPDGVKPSYTPTGLPQIIALRNPQWNEQNDDEIEEERFREAMDIAGKVLTDVVRKIGFSDMPCGYEIRQALENRSNIHESEQIIELSGYMPFKTYIFELEELLGIKKPILFVIYPDRGVFKILCVPVDTTSFENRLGLNEKWRGLENEELVKVSGIEGSVFVHGGGFIGSNKTRDGALQMCIQSMSPPK